MNTLLGKTHLEFYQQHQIAPVRYDLQDMQAHLDRRATLYLKLGLPPLAFRSARVLEVAAGVGHNSLYLAHMLPEQLVLLEPNAIGIKHIHEVYSHFNKPHTVPEVVTSKLESYSPNAPFDIVLCENWLGTSEHELSLLKKLSTMVAPLGALVITTVSPIGFVPNLLRRLLAMYIAPLQEGFDKRTELLVNAFSSHLDTLKAMTRNKTDWVQDNMINPAYFKLCLSIPMVIEHLGDRFEVMGSSPSIAEDWRWFKSLYGSCRQMNEHFLSEYWSKAHNFLDYREPITRRDPALNMQLEEKALSLLHAIEMHEDTHMQSINNPSGVDNILCQLEEFLALVPANFSAAIHGLEEVKKMIGSLSAGTPLPEMLDFSPLFGRETAYVSLLRKTS